MKQTAFLHVAVLAFIYFPVYVLGLTPARLHISFCMRPEIGLCAVHTFAHTSIGRSGGFVLVTLQMCCGASARALLPVENRFRTIAIDLMQLATGRARRPTC